MPAVILDTDRPFNGQWRRADGSDLAGGSHTRLPPPMALASDAQRPNVPMGKCVASGALNSEFRPSKRCGSSPSRNCSSGHWRTSPWRSRSPTTKRPVYHPSGELLQALRTGDSRAHSTVATALPATGLEDVARSVLSSGLGTRSWRTPTRVRRVRDCTGQGGAKRRF